MTVQQIEQLDDIGLLKQACIEMVETIHQRDDAISRLTDDNTRLADDNHQLKSQVAYLSRQQFGRKSERYEDPNQQKLGFTTDGEAEAVASPEADDTTETVTVTRKKPRNRGKRRPIPDDLPQVERVYDLPEDQKTDPQTGETLKLIGKKVSKQLNYVPGRMEAVVHVRLVYGRPGENLDGEQPEVVVAPRPAEGLAKCLAAPGLLAHVAVSKYTDHLPLNRLETIFRRGGYELSRASMCRWMQGVGGLLTPLVELMKRRMLEHSVVIQTDDTPVRQQDPGGGKSKTKTCHFWPYLGQADTEGHYVVFDYSASRSGDHPEAWFRGPEGQERFVGGYLQCDGFSGYNDLFKADGGWGMTHVGCWAHARRKFFDAKGGHHQAAKHALEAIGRLYGLEREIKELDPEARRAARQERAGPEVEGLMSWCREQQAKGVLPKSALGKALTYALNQEASLRAYLSDGELAIDNNDCERSLRGVAIGRKNWLFIGSPAGGKAAAAILSVLGSAKLHGVEPLGYLTELITKLPATPEDDLSRFLPDVWGRP